jgi:hypothetical protein
MAGILRDEIRELNKKAAAVEEVMKVARKDTLDPAHASGLYKRKPRKAEKNKDFKITK